MYLKSSGWQNVVKNLREKYGGASDSAVGYCNTSCAKYEKCRTWQDDCPMKSNGKVVFMLGRNDLAMMAYEAKVNSKALADLFVLFDSGVSWNYLGIKNLYDENILDETFIGIVPYGKEIIMGNLEALETLNEMIDSVPTVNCVSVPVDFLKELAKKIVTMENKINDMKNHYERAENNYKTCLTAMNNNQKEELKRTYERAKEIARRNQRMKIDGRFWHD